MEMMDVARILEPGISVHCTNTCGLRVGSQCGIVDVWMAGTQTREATGRS